MTTAVEDSDLSEIFSQEASDNSENEVDDLQHSALIDAVSQLDSKHRIKPPTRKEPSLHVSEFHLIQRRDDEKGVQVNELAKVLKKRSSHAEIGKKLHSFQKKSSTLPKPLEKIESEKIRREIGFENVKEELSKWDSVVHKNRAEPTLIFPLRQPSSRVQPMNKFVSKLKALKPGTLEAEIETFLAQAPEISKEDESEEEDDDVSLTLEEMMERRKEMARLRARQSYKEAKAARHSKIKSKKFHRIERKAKLKEQLKNFEALQKTDPEAALKQLEEIEKARVEERMSLRHRTTGKWAKSKAIRAKYDPDSRKALAEQLALSRQLTEKVGKENSSDEEAEETGEPQPLELVKDSDNPWLHETDPEINKFVAGYRKYWEERNKKENISLLKNIQNKNDSVNRKGCSNTTPDIVIDVQNNGDIQRTVEQNLTEKIDNIYEKKLLVDTSVNKSKRNKKKNKKKKDSEKNVKEMVSGLTNLQHGRNKSKHKGNVGSSIVLSDDESQPTSSSVNSSSLDLSVMSTSDSWIVEEMSHSSEKPKKLLHDHALSKNVKKNNDKTLLNGNDNKIDIDDLFVEMEQKVRDKANVKVNGLMSRVNSNGNISDSDTASSVDEQGNVTFLQRKGKKRFAIDEQLEEVPFNSSPVTKNSNIEKLIKAAEIKRDKCRKKEKSNNSVVMTDIDPNNYLKLKPKSLSSGLPDLITAGDEVLDDDDNGAVEFQKTTIAEAFADDDVIAEFREEKQEAVDKSRPQDIDMTLPGWGEWVGPNMKVSKRKKKRFILKFPEEAPRRDDNKGNVIINEDKDVKIKEHQVNTLPFPFESVKDFEASIRCPLGNTWVPETAHRKLIRPDVITQLGAVIEPMNEDVLVKNKKFKI